MYHQRTRAHVVAHVASLKYDSIQSFIVSCCAAPSPIAVTSALAYSDRPGFMFYCTSRSIDITRRLGVMVASDDLQEEANMIGHGMRAHHVCPPCVPCYRHDVNVPVACRRISMCAMPSSRGYCYPFIPLCSLHCRVLGFS
jgi:hypothetical protein